MNKVTIQNETDRIKIKPTEWLYLKEWRDINDMPRVQGFNWLPNGIAVGLQLTATDNSSH